MAERILIGMSGGVDSSVAAARLVDAGFEVIGVTLHLWDEPVAGLRSRCCAPEDIRDARRVADQLGIAHYTLDRRASFEAQIVRPFVSAYLDGHTPSPCPRCNATIKMPALRRLARLMGARRIATGHYARIVSDPSGAPRVARGRDRSKDQSYFLYDLDTPTLEALVLPLGESHKPEVREEALRRGLVGAAKGESQDLCIVPDGDYAAFVEAHAFAPIPPGTIVDAQGRIVGSHTGVHRFTIGQRKGLRIALGRPMFVTQIDAATRQVVIGEERALMVRELVVAAPRVAGGVELPTAAVVKVRYRHDGAPARLALDGARLRVIFDEPVRAASPGQVAVAYQDDLVAAGGVIERVIPWDHCGIPLAGGKLEP